MTGEVSLPLVASFVADPSYRASYLLNWQLSRGTGDKHAVDPGDANHGLHNHVFPCSLETAILGAKASSVHADSTNECETPRCCGVGAISGHLRFSSQWFEEEEQCENFEELYLDVLLLTCQMQLMQSALVVEL
ncbi:hypothetical protein KM043_000107 [Ampulex compressa]|nr:hypothetical protein KM043_000107 [Ampulex compressa]